MPLRRLATTAALAATLAALPAGAQLPNVGGLSGLLKGGAMPDVGSVGVGNAAGLLSYCLKNQLLGGAGGGGLGGGTGGGAGAALGALTGRPGVASSPGFSAGQAGTLVTGKGQSLPVGGLGDQLKGRLCGMVLQRAKALL